MIVMVNVLKFGTLLFLDPFFMLISTEHGISFADKI